MYLLINLIFLIKLDFKNIFVFFSIFVIKNVIFSTNTHSLL